MIVKFYNCTSDNNVLNKSISHIADVDVTLTGDNVKESPTILCSYNASLINANYCYIPTFNRYYFISPHELMTGNRITFQCKTDLIMSAKSDILSSVGTFTRCNKKNVAISDPLVMKTSTVNVKYRKMGNPIPTTNDGCYLMSVAQGFIRTQTEG